MGEKALRFRKINHSHTFRIEKEVVTMQWELIVALVIAMPIILFPAAYVWYLNAGGIAAAIKEAREKRIARRRGTESSEEILQEQEYQSALTEALKNYPWD